jgi:hypothetical protein
MDAQGGMQNIARSWVREWEAARGLIMGTSRTWAGHTGRA